MTKRILVAVDLSESSARTVATAYEIAAGKGAILDALHVTETPPAAVGMGHPAAKGLADALSRSEAGAARREVERLLAGVPDAHRGEAIVAHGNPVEVICQTADPERYDMVVVSTHGRTGFTHMLIGSVAERVVRHARVPVLVVR